MAAVNCDISGAELARTLEEFLLQHPRAVVLEDGRVLFEMKSARYTVGAEHGRCLLHLWSAELNLVRTVTSLDARRHGLRLGVKRLGQPGPQHLQIVADRDQRTPTTREAGRKKFLRLLERALARAFADDRLDHLSTAMDLEHSFGPAYARGVLLHGQRACAIIAVNAGETQATIDGILTLAVLWFTHCREHGGGRRLYEGVKIIVPTGTGETTRTRMAWMNKSIAKWELYELDERSETLDLLDIEDSGNLRTGLAQAFHAQAAVERVAGAIGRVKALLPPPVLARVEISATSPVEVVMMLHGLEFVRIRHGVAAGSFAREDRITFGAGANETELMPQTEELFRELLLRLAEHRTASGTVRNPVFRLQPERWLESELRRQMDEVLPSVRGDVIYSQVPAVSGGERGMLDLLAVTQQGRLAVLELKADEDLHLPLQALDYWMRVRRLHAEGALARHGYFPGVQLAEAAPVLYLIAPALRIHPANETVLKHLSPEVDWVLVALAESWRKRLKVVFRKRSRAGPV